MCYELACLVSLACASQWQGEGREARDTVRECKQTQCRPPPPPPFLLYEDEVVIQRNAIKNVVMQMWVCWYGGRDGRGESEGVFLCL